MTNMQASSTIGLELRRVYNASPERLFAAWTTPEAMERFFGPGEVQARDVSVDLRVGGRYQITMVMADGEKMIAGGVYREIDPPHRLVCTWSWEEDEPELEIETVLTLEFLPKGNATELVLRHEGFRDDDQRDRHSAGWTQIVEQLGASCGLASAR
jgi:uncharacterized protein YndB with AHSA1/START domain